MSEHQHDREDILETMERIAEEDDMEDSDDDDDDDSFDDVEDDVLLAGGESMETPSGESVFYGAKSESMGTEGAAFALIMSDEEEYEKYRRDGSFDDSQSTNDQASMPYPRRGSQSSRRSSYVSTDSGATSRSGSFQESPSLDHQRSFDSRPRRRQSINLTSVHTSTSLLEEARSDGTPTKIMKNLRPISRLSKRGPSNRRTGAKSEEDMARHQSAFMSVAQMGHTQLEDAATAAAVVAMSTDAAVSTTRKKYVVDDYVLILLNLLNLTNSVDPPETFTVMPVNKYGFPPGEGDRSEEQEGPYVFVMAIVKRVHFDEDVPYYTVLRADTGTEQRAENAWMEPLTDYHGIQAATRAAHETVLSATYRSVSAREQHAIRALSVKPINFLKETVVPWYHAAREATKQRVRRVIWGDAPFYCRLQITTVNLLVACSFVFMFIEVTSLAFFPSGWDYGVAVVGVIVWSILMLELIFEWLIRPSHYYRLMLSSKAYAPSSARYLDSFHLLTEFVALLTFIPEFECLTSRVCGKRVFFSGVDAALSAVYGPTVAKGFYGRFCIGLISLRMIGLVRHWKIMWINRTFRDNAVAVGGKPAFIETVQVSSVTGRSMVVKRESVAFDKNGEDTTKTEEELKRTTEEDRCLKQAATIGTALMVVNSHRALMLIITIIITMPIFISFLGTNNAAPNFVHLLQQNNLMLSEENATSCEFLQQTIGAWLDVGANVQTQVPQYNVTEYVLWAQLLPVRCPFQRQNLSEGVITNCTNGTSFPKNVCDVWDLAPSDPLDATPEYYADLLNIRVGGISEYVETNTDLLTNTTFSVRLLVNENHAISFVFEAEFSLLSAMLILLLYGLAVLRSDAGRLVLGPLQRMLKIVVRYAENPLAQPVQQKTPKPRSRNSNTRDHDGDYDHEYDSSRAQLGNYETEQLISAITKIADLLRKCWGVAGAGIISTNLARTQDGMTIAFNPTVPGKRVYAIFGFVAIDRFGEQLRALDADVMILINDVAKIVHDEVFRWALGNSGQCNKNLGNAFLMVFRIGDFNEVHERKARATDVVFSSDKRTSRSRTLRQRGRTVAASTGASNAKIRHERGRRHLDTGESLTLASLPGIQSFADRALLGLLKSFAGIYRDKSIQNWKKDFRLGAGVGAFNVHLMIGMDAGWAVEGAVGSEYKIDATYLSPHVNMASRMMSASRQYGVTLLLSQAVEELLSKPAQDKLRHLDTVYVKGSSVAQRVFTYDARYHGVDFFLFERTPEQADMDAEAYTPLIWDTDQDLLAMRQHVTDAFQRKFQEGVSEYLAGKWEHAIATLREADDLMITTVLEEGFVEYNPDEGIDERIFDRKNSDYEIMNIRNELGDGACRCLINYMERRKGIPSKNWEGVRPLTSK